MIAYIEKLLKGQPVEWKTLGEVAEIGTGSSNRQDEVESGKYPFYVRSKSILRSSTYQFDETAIIIPGEGGIGDIYHFANGKYALHQRAYRVHLHNNSLLDKFVYHYMRTHFKRYILSKSVGATATSIRKPMLENFSVPIPPLNIQTKIVHILDTFMELEKELEEELEARRKQYEYYRNSLLSFDKSGGGGKIMYKPLEDVFSMRNGYTPSKSKKELWEGGSIPWYRMEDLRTGARMLSDAIQHITPKAIKGKGLFQANSIIMATTATIGEHALLVVEGLANQQFTNFEIKSEYRERLLPKFAYYYFFSIGAWCKQNTNVSSFPSVAISSLKIQTIPIPPLPEQRRIVRILDKFDVLTNSLTEGLPKEVELRRKQYEYYREQLLSFPKN